MKQLIYAHRGASFDFPENTMIAFENAIKQGADGIELDVHFTKDKKLVICHDDDIGRTANGAGSIEGMTYKELLGYDFGVRKDAKFTGTKIPTLEEVLKLIRDSGILLNIELKNRAERSDGLERATVDMVNDFGLNDKIIYSSFDHSMVYRLKEYEPGAKIGALYSHTPFRAYEYMKDLGVDAIHPKYTCTFTQDMCSLALANDWQVNVWTVDTLSDAKPLVEAGVTSLITNRPGFLREQLSK